MSAADHHWCVLVVDWLNWWYLGVSLQRPVLLSLLVVPQRGELSLPPHPLHPPSLRQGDRFVVYGASEKTDRQTGGQTDSRMCYLIVGARRRCDTVDHTPTGHTGSEAASVVTMATKVFTDNHPKCDGKVRVCSPVCVSPCVFCPARVGFDWRTLDTQTGSVRGNQFDQLKIFSLKVRSTSCPIHTV